MQRNSATIHRVCKCYSLCDTERYADLQQEIALALWREVGRHGLLRFRGKSKESTWVYHIAVNAAITYHRRNDSKVPLVSLDEATMDLPIPTDEQARKEWMEELLALLSDDDRRLLLLWLDDNDYKRIAELEGLSEVAVGTRLSRVRHKLKEKIKRKE